MSVCLPPKLVGFLQFPNSPEGVLRGTPIFTLLGCSSREYGLTVCGFDGKPFVSKRSGLRRLLAPNKNKNGKDPIEIMAILNGKQCRLALTTYWGFEPQVTWTSRCFHGALQMVDTLSPIVCPRRQSTSYLLSMSALGGAESWSSSRAQNNLCCKSELTWSSMGLMTAQRIGL